jgi:endonuclease/exonuclease/phosphatase family metal-dependent hydrolase
MALVSHVEWFEKQLVVYNVHLESRSSDALRYGQLAEIFNDARQHGSEVPSLIAGDFNLDLSGETVASMISGAKFNNPFHSGKAHHTTMPSRLRRSRAIDWILTRGPINCAEPDLHDSVCASDHYPLSLSLLCK